MNRAEAKQIIEAARGKRILVVGDIMLDRYMIGRVLRVSPEAPVPVVDLEQEISVLGGAGNVAMNILSLGGIPVIIGTIGRDAAAMQIRSILAQHGIGAGGIVETDHPTTVKTRVIARSGQATQQIVRFDRDTTARGASVDASIRAAIARTLSSVSAVIASDYEKGVLSKDVLFSLLVGANGAIPVFCDPKSPRSDYSRVTCIKPNLNEAQILLGRALKTEEDFGRAGAELIQKYDAEHVLLTRGEDGMTLYSRQQRGIAESRFPSCAREVYDGCGAGDTVIAAVALAVSGGATMAWAAELANVAAGIVVGKQGAAQCTPEEIYRSLPD